MPSMARVIERKSTPAAAARATTSAFLSGVPGVMIGSVMSQTRASACRSAAVAGIPQRLIPSPPDRIEGVS
jgi:hypothetical protein